MRRTLTLKLISIFAIGLATSAWAETNHSSSTSVWKVSKGGDTVYIGGTVHILPISEFPLPTAFTDVYQNSDTIVLEADLPEPTDLAAQQKIIAAMSYGNGKTLKDEISNETYSALNQYLGAFGTSADQIAGFKPGLIATMLVTMEAQRNQLAGEGVDAYFTQLAKRDSKPREFLESLEFQVNMLAQMGEGEEDRFIAETLATLPELKEMLQSTIKAWRVGDTNKLNELIIDTFKRESPASFDEVFIKRNQNWVPKIEAMFGDDDKEFVLVGTGHLVGQSNVLALLKEKGYLVEQL